jgi:hypothetical protein
MNLNCDQGKELGYQFLDTRFTGTQTPFLSGSCDPELEGIIIKSDRGVAHNLSDVELKTYF